MHTQGLTYPHRALQIHTGPYMYTHSLTYTHIALYVHTQSYMYKHSFICTHRALHLHTQSYICTHILSCTHTALYVHTSPTCLNTFMMGRVEIKYKLQSLLTLQVIFSQDTTSGMFNQTKDLEESCLDKLTYIFHPLVIIKWKTDLPIPQTRGVHCDLSHQPPLTLHQGRSEEGSTGPSL